VVYVDDDDMLDGSVHTIKKNIEILVNASKETGLEVNADIPTYMVTSRDQNVRRIYSIKTHNSSFERVEQFKYLGTTLNQNSIQEEIKSTLNSGKACYHSVQSLLSSSVLSKACYHSVQSLLSSSVLSKAC
jgi:valyl-tRNA synthetase